MIGIESTGIISVGTLALKWQINADILPSKLAYYSIQAFGGNIARSKRLPLVMINP